MFTLSATVRLAFLSILGASTLSLAQDSSTTSYVAAASSTGSSTSSSPITHTIGVAEGGFTFVPNVVLAEVGDYIEYQFYPTNHSVVRSEYGYPCIPYEDTGVDRIGFFSGFMPVDTILPDPPSFSIRVNDSNPIFYYCSAPGSCIGHGMVGVINPNATESVAVQTQLALNSTIMLQPGEPWPSESENPFSTSAGGSVASSTAKSTSTSATATAPAATTSAAPAASSHGSGLSPGGIAGVAIGAAAVALLAAALLFLCGRASRKNQHELIPAQSYGPVSYISHTPVTKHLSVMTHPDGRQSGFYGRQSNLYTSSTLPGYIPQHDPSLSPTLAAARPVSQALNPGNVSDIISPNSPSHSDTMDAPAYAHGTPQMIVPTHGVYEIPPQGPHEMYAAPTATEQQEAGVMGFINRRSSTRKSGGVERYG